MQQERQEIQEQLEPQEQLERQELRVLAWFLRARGIVVKRTKQRTLLHTVGRVGLHFRRVQMLCQPRARIGR